MALVTIDNNEMTHGEYQAFCDAYDITFETGVELNSRRDTRELLLEFKYLRIDEGLMMFHELKSGNLYIPFRYKNFDNKIWTVHLL